MAMKSLEEARRKSSLGGVAAEEVLGVCERTTIDDGEQAKAVKSTNIKKLAM
jgi:hypothetical protein